MASFTVDSYPTSNHDLTHSISGAGTPGVGQGFAGANGVLDRVRWYVTNAGWSPVGNMVAKVYTHSGTFGSTGVPGSLLATSGIISASTLTASLALIDFEFTGANRITLVAGTNYFVTFEYPGTSMAEVSVDITAPTHGGNVATYNGTVWAANATQDMIFYVLAGKSSQANALLGVG